MRWTPGGSSSDVEDRRGQGGGFGGGGMRMGLGGFVVLLVLSLVFRKDFFSLVGGGAPAADPTGQAPAGPVQTTPEEDERAQFVTFVLNDTQDTWTKILADRGKQYERATLVLFRDATQTACGVGQAAAGPFYCPGDNRVYIDLGFYDELRDRFGRRGRLRAGLRDRARARPSRAAAARHRGSGAAGAAAAARHGERPLR